MLPLFPDLSEEQQDHVIERICETTAIEPGRRRMSLARALPDRLREGRFFAEYSARASRVERTRSLR